jgi:hypothetical protein
MESVAGWKTARLNRPVQIFGSFDGIETGIRQLSRQKPLETATIEFRGHKITVPTEAEILRIKAALILKRNATRDYLDFVALATHLGDEKAAGALKYFDQLYPQPNDESALQQLQIQLANPMPYDLDQTELKQYKQLDPKWHDWEQVKAACTHVAIALFDRLTKAQESHEQTPPAVDPTESQQISTEFMSYKAIARDLLGSPDSQLTMRK